MNESPPEDPAEPKTAEGTPTAGGEESLSLLGLGGEAPEAKAESEGEGEAKADSKSKPKSAPKTKSKAKPKSEPVADAEPELKGEAKPELKGEAKPEPVADAEPELKGEAKPEAKSEPVADAEPELKGEPEPVAEAEVEVEVVSVAAPPPADKAAVAVVAAYRVLARKYRPQSFDALVGQEALVRTLANAIRANRLPHAILLTGVRGIGKTTTARLIARAVNYTGSDGTKGPTAEPTDDCEVCASIAADRHPDVVEMDAASRTGVDDVRELIENARYKPISARCKVYIIDEVHMLSASAFNALLKTLEEPPEHVMFVFATTEVRKVPVTVLSRCMRFDLKRLSRLQLIEHLAYVAGQEKIEVERDALAAIARAAEGSVRDGLSLLDQAIVLADGPVSLAAARDMLGLADRGKVADLLNLALQGNPGEALQLHRRLIRDGANAETLLADLLELTHALAAVIATGEGADEVDGIEAAEVKSLAQNYGMPALVRAFQILLKGVAEVRTAPNPEISLEMLLLRLAYTAPLPDPGALVKRWKELGVSVDAAAASPSPSASPSGNASGNAGVPAGENAARAPRSEPVPATAEALEGLLHRVGEIKLALDFRTDYSVVRFARGNLVLAPLESAVEAEKFVVDLRKVLCRETPSPWSVELDASAPVGESLKDKSERRAGEQIAEAKTWPSVREVLQHFPDAKIVRAESEGQAQAEAPDDEADLAATP